MPFSGFRINNAGYSLYCVNENNLELRICQVIENNIKKSPLRSTISTASIRVIHKEVPCTIKRDFKISKTDNSLCRVARKSPILTCKAAQTYLEQIRTHHSIREIDVLQIDCRWKIFLHILGAVFVAAARLTARQPENDLMSQSTLIFQYWFSIR